MSNFNITIVSNPGAALAPNTLCWESDLDSLPLYDEGLIKPALLFAEDVTLVTFRQEMIDWARGDILHATRQGVRQVMQVLNYLQRQDPGEMRFFGFDRLKLPSKGEASRRINEINSTRGFDTDVIFGLIDQVGKDYSEILEAYCRSIVNASKERIAALRSSSIESAIDAGIVSVEGWGTTEDVDYVEIGMAGYDAHQMRAINSVAERMQASGGPMMIEPGTSRTFGAKASSQRRNADPAIELATSSIGHIPGLSKASISEVLDIREDLSDYLPAFRAEMMSLSDSMNSIEPDRPAQDVAKQLDRIWDAQINPTLIDIKNKVKRGGFRRHLLEEFSSAQGVLAATATPIVTLATGTLAGGIAAIIPGVATGLYPFVKAANSTLKDRYAAKDNRLYFLYQAQRKLS